MKNSFYTMRPEPYKIGLYSLIEYINKIKPTYEMNMLEIGTYLGESTIIFSQKFKNVITIDPYIDNYDANDPTCNYISLNEVYKKFLEKTSEIKTITLIKKTSDDAIHELKDKKFDFIYIDGMHTYDQVKKDIKNYKPLVKEGGFIGGHDYHPNWQGVINAINEEINNVDFIFEDTSWIKKI